MPHNFTAQRRETFDTFKDLPKGEKLPETAVVDFLFFAEELDANWKACEAALKAKGFTCSRDEDYLIASFGPMKVTPEAIWEREELATKIALSHDFYPDGWDLGLEG